MSDLFKTKKKGNPFGGSDPAGASPYKTPKLPPAPDAKPALDQVKGVLSAEPDKFAQEVKFQDENDLVEVCIVCMKIHCVTCQAPRKYVARHLAVD